MVRPMEEEMRSIEGVKEMSASSYESGGNVLLEFDAGFDVDTALQDVREAVDRVKPDLPEEADEPTVNEVNLSLFPVLVVTLSGEPCRSAPWSGWPATCATRSKACRRCWRSTSPATGKEVVEIIVDPLLGGELWAERRRDRPGGQPLEPAGGRRHPGHRQRPVRHQGARPVRAAGGHPQPAGQGPGRRGGGIPRHRHGAADFRGPEGFRPGRRLSGGGSGSLQAHRREHHRHHRGGPRRGRGGARLLAGHPCR